MRRPIGVTIIAVLFLAAAVYLWIGAATVLVAPKSASPFIGRILKRDLLLIGPYASLCAGICYAVVGWGLFRLHNWARWLAMLVMTVGGALMMLGLASAAMRFHWSAVWLGSQIVLRATGVFYLLGPEVIDTFNRPR